jgi:hypothetical protein
LFCVAIDHDRLRQVAMDLHGAVGDAALEQVERPMQGLAQVVTDAAQLGRFGKIQQSLDRDLHALDLSHDHRPVFFAQAHPGLFLHGVLDRV